MTELSERTEVAEPQNAAEAVTQIGLNQASFRNGKGPNTRAADLELGRRFALRLDKINARWDDIERDVAAERPMAKSSADAMAAKLAEKLAAAEQAAVVAPVVVAEPVPEPLSEKEIGLAKERAALAGGGLSFLPRSQLRIVNEPEAEPPSAEGAETEPKASAAVVRLITKRQAEPEPEGEPEGPEAPAPAGWQLPPFASEKPLAYDRTDPAVLSVAGSYDNAREYARRFCFRDGCLAMYYWHEKFWKWNGRVYEPLSMEVLRSTVYGFLDESWKREANKKGDGVERVRFRPAPKDVSNLVDGLKAGLVLQADCNPPTWLDTGLIASEVLMFRNGLVEVMTERKVEATPRLWMHSALDYDWNPKAQCPGWLRFLEEVFPGDSESKDCTEEALGYSMTEDVSLQKGMLLVGKPRSGKGTIAAKVLRKLVGPAAFVSLNFHQWTATENSREDLIGKKAGVFPDVRLKPPKWYGQTFDPGGMDHKSTELVLAITSGDPVSVRTKYQVGAWHGVLPAKLWLVSNTVPNFNDPTLPSRFVKLAFGKSWLGREDIGLAKRLEAEAEGIAVRCVRAYQRLVRRGRFIQPKAGLELERAVGESSDPFSQFAKETFVVDLAGDLSFTSVWIKFETWCSENGRTDLQKSIVKQNFRKNLRQVPGFEGVGGFRPHGQSRRITGLRFRRLEEQEGW